MPEPALRGALAVRREKEGQLPTTSLEIEYLHWKRRCEMLIGGDDISNDVITLTCVFQCLFTFALVSASHWLAEIWQLRRRKPQGNSNSRDVVARSLSFSRPAARAPRKGCSQASSTWILDSNGRRDSRFQSPTFRIPQAQISQIPESGLP